MSITTTILTTSYNSTIHDVKKSNEFVELKTNHINLGFDFQKTIWLKIKLQNESDKSLKKYIVIDNPLLEKVFFFDSKTNIKPYKTGMLYVSNQREEIFPSYNLSLQPQELRIIYVQIQNKTTTLQFGIKFQDEKTFKNADKIKQFSILIFIGLLSAFVIYSIFLYVYTKDSSYYLYSFYLVVLMFQQLTYIGFLPLYAPSSFVQIDNLIVVPKVSMIVVSAALFAKNFLKIEQFPKINKIYKAFIVIIILQMPIFGTMLLYVPEVSLFIGFLFIVFNTYCGFYVYFHGNRQARFFIVGWLFLFFGYILTIFDAFGLLSVMNKFPELLLWITVIEAIFLMLAFVDKLNILTNQKKELDKKLYKELNSRQEIIQKEVVQRTSQLQVALEERVVLFRELNHRVKNNLQLILSIIRLQKFDLKDKGNSSEFEKLENRIKAISKTHEILCERDDLVEINMNEYISELCEEISESVDENIEFELKIDAKMILRQAVYVGLITNELVANSIKHAFKEKTGIISISLEQQIDKFILSIGDSGQGYDENLINKKGLGLRLVESLVTSQLEGTLSLQKKDNYTYKIIF